jgi:hypothetical protein
MKDTSQRESTSFNTCSLPPPSMTRPALSSISAGGKHSVRVSPFLTGMNAVIRPPTLSNGFPKALSDPMTCTSFVNGGVLLLFVSCDTMASRIPSKEVNDGTVRQLMFLIGSLRCGFLLTRWIGYYGIKRTPSYL